MDLGTCVIKHCLGLFNFIFVVVGGATLGLGVWLAADQSSVVTLSKMANQDTIKEYASASLIEQLGWFFIALGAFIFIISFLGYCGTMKESRVLLGMYSFFLGLIFILEIVLVVLFFVNRSEMEKETRSVLTFSLQKFYSAGDRANSFTVNMDYTMAHVIIRKFNSAKRADAVESTTTQISTEQKCSTRTKLWVREFQLRAVAWD